MDPARVAQDLQRSFERSLEHELELQAAHEAGDFERALLAAIRLKGSIRRSSRLMEAFRRSSR